MNSPSSSFQIADHPEPSITALETEDYMGLLGQSQDVAVALRKVAGGRRSERPTAAGTEGPCRPHQRRSQSAPARRHSQYRGFRRAVASNLYELGANEKIVQRILRHANPRVTKERYIKAFDPAVLEAMQRLQATMDVLEKSPAVVQQVN
jgi:hypothetical protein